MISNLILLDKELANYSQLFTTIFFSDPQ